MKGKRLLILGAALALGISACAQATTMVRKTPFKAADPVSVTWAGTVALPGTATKIENSDITIMVSATNTYTNPIRVYANTTITIGTTNGATINSVTYEASSTGNYVTYAQNATVSPNVTPEVDGKNVTWNLSGATEFTFKPSSQTRANSIAVNYTPDDGSSSSSSSSSEPSSSTSGSSEEQINYGTAENPLTIAEAKLVLEKTGSEFSAQPLFVRGVVSTNKAFSTQYDNGEIWLQSDDGSVAKALQLYSCGINSSIQNTADLKGVDGLKGCEVVATGYGKIYNNTTYEITNTTIDGNRVNPEIVSLTRPALTGISLNKSTLTLEKGESETLTVSPIPVAAELGSVTWESSNSNVASVSDGVITAVNAGTATITATASGKTASCAVTISSTSTSVALPENGLELNYDVLGLSTHTTYASNHNRNVTVGDFDVTLDPNSSDAITKASAPYNSANLGFDCMQFKKGPYEAIAIDTKIEAAKKATVALYTWGYETQANNYLPSFKIGSSSSSILANETNGGTTNATGVDTGITYTSTGNSPQTKKIYSFTLTYDLSSLLNEKLTFVTAAGGATYIKSIVIDNIDESSVTPEHYLSEFSSYATIHGRESGTTVSKLVFAELGFDNEEVVTGADIDSNIALACYDNEQTNVPKYYSSGSSLRIYTGNSMKISANNGTGAKIIKIEFAFASGSGYSTALSSTDDLYNNGTWSGEASSIEFNLSAQSRIVSISVTYYVGTFSVDNAAIRFGASVSQSNWTAIKNHEGWAIQDYGVMMLKKATLQGYGKSSVGQAYKDGKAVSIVNKTKNGAAYADPYNNNGVYSFTAKLSFANTADYDEVVVAAPFIKVNSEYYFLNEVEFSVNSLAAYYLNNPTYMGGASLSNKGLTYLSTAH